MATARQIAHPFGQLRRDILNGRFAPGEPLRLAALSAEYRVSATPLREALSRLEEKDFVVASPNRGWRVARVSLDELADLESARTTIETDLLRGSIARGDLDWETGIVAAHHRLGQTAKPLDSDDLARREAWVTAHDGFHSALLAAAPSCRLKRYHAETMEQLHRHHQALLFHPRAINPGHAAPHSDRARALLGEAVSLGLHTRLMEATLARDAAAAAALLHDHIQLALTVYRSIAGAETLQERSSREEDSP